MNEDGTPIEGEQSAANSSVSREGAVEQPSQSDVQSMYDDLGIKATAPTSATKGRPKTAGVRGKDVSEYDDGNSDGGRKNDKNSGGKSKDAPDSDENGDSGSKDSAKQSQKRGADGKVSDESEEAGKGVRKTESKSDEYSERGGSKKSDGADRGDGQQAGESDGEEEEGQEAGKRPGKSDPKVERRFQKLANDAREKDEHITAQNERIQQLESQLRESTQQRQQAEVDREDPEYTLDDFRGDVQDSEGNIVRLTEEQSELAYRRWRDGYDQRKSERDARANFDNNLRQSQENYQREQMQKSVEAYDTLTSTLENYPALDPQDQRFDKELSDAVMPLIEEMVLYQEGTEPGNEQGIKPVIVGLAMNPSKLLDVIGKLRDAKRNLPLNGTHDNVESGSNVSVPHGRSSDPSVNEANELMKHFGINKRF